MTGITKQTESGKSSPILDRFFVQTKVLKTAETLGCNIQRTDSHQGLIKKKLWMKPLTAKFKTPCDEKLVMKSVTK